MRTRIENDNTLQARAHGTRMGRMLGRIATVALLGLCPWAASSAPPPWQAAPYTYQAENQPLRLALEEFARHFGLRAQVTPDVEGLVNGRIGAPTPTEFMDRLSNMFGLIWFHYGGTIYVTRSTNRVTRSLALPSTEAGTLKKAMEDLGLYEPPLRLGGIARPRSRAGFGPARIRRAGRQGARGPAGRAVGPGGHGLQAQERSGGRPHRAAARPHDHDARSRDDPA
jgi:hypothetical protein